MPTLNILFAGLIYFSLTFYDCSVIDKVLLFRKFSLPFFLPAGQRPAVMKIGLFKPFVEMENSPIPSGYRNTGIHKIIGVIIYIFGCFCQETFRIQNPF
jgi:hypothetical protein